LITAMEIRALAAWCLIRAMAALLLASTLLLAFVVAALAFFAATFAPAFARLAVAVLVLIRILIRVLAFPVGVRLVFPVLKIALLAFLRGTFVVAAL
jgi:hypothetical protein